MVCLSIYPSDGTRNRCDTFQVKKSHSASYAYAYVDGYGPWSPSFFISYEHQTEQNIGEASKLKSGETLKKSRPIQRQKSHMIQRAKLECHTTGIRN